MEMLSFESPFKYSVWGSKTSPSHNYPIGYKATKVLELVPLGV